MRDYYGVNAVMFDTLKGDGSGQTIAIVDAYDDPALVSSTSPNFANSDLARFDQYFGLPNLPSFTKMSETGSTTTLPTADAGWAVEESLDVEWAHSIAPAASIVLVEATTASNADLFAAEKYAAALPGVSVVSNSWSGGEYKGESA
jgi:subtilase family serine protease